MGAADGSVVSQGLHGDGRGHGLALQAWPRAFATGPSGTVSPGPSTPDAAAWITAWQREHRATCRQTPGADDGGYSR